MALPMVLVYDASTTRRRREGAALGASVARGCLPRRACALGQRFWQAALRARAPFFTYRVLCANDRTRGMALRAVLPGLQRLSDAPLPSTGRLEGLDRTHSRRHARDAARGRLWKRTREHRRGPPTTRAAAATRRTLTAPLQCPDLR